MSKNHNYCVILAGGVDTRFWPISREDKPKQFQIPVDGGSSFLQQAYNRMLGIFKEDHIYIASLSRYRDIIFDQLPDIPEDNLILEPYGRNTATTIAFSAFKLLSKDPEAMMVIGPSDQKIDDVDRFRESLRKAVSYATDNDVLMTLGIVPSSPNTNFGYVQVTGGKDAYASLTPLKAKTFTEKPSKELAQVFLDSGEFLWNSGIFVWKAESIVREMDTCCPEITRLWKGWEKEIGTIHERKFVEKIYTDSPNVSIDYAVLEKSDKLWILPTDFDWTDIGGFNTLYCYKNRVDENGNLIFVPGKKILRESGNNILYESTSRKLIVVRGMQDFVVVDTPDVLMICPMDDQKLQETFSELHSPGFEDYK